MSKETTNNIPVWVNFPELPIQYWMVENLGRIASSIGNPICTDKLTAQEARISYARMLIEMDVSQPLPETVLIETAGKKLSYDWQPSFCQDYLQIGHGQAGNRKQGEQHRRGRKQVTKWIAKPKADMVTPEQEVRAEPSNENATTSVVIRQEVVSSEIIQNENAEFQVAKSKGKQVQSPKVKISIRNGLSKENIEAMLHQNRFSALRIQEREDASQASKEGRVPLAHPP
uniref:DUF4283 domain-containing protein n=1 Tax=Nicotiana tabacum TaxID=4097 RepID=A0A1S3Z2F5_TOBAC|nr:PREDICTED: uncharacterized protein LOC107782255 [Nicotiana tabacum]